MRDRDKIKFKKKRSTSNKQERTIRLFEKLSDKTEENVKAVFDKGVREGFSNPIKDMLQANREARKRYKQ